MGVSSLSTIGSIAIHLYEVIPSLPAGVSGNLVVIADMARQHVENYTGIPIGSNSIDSAYQTAIVNFAKADTINLVNSQPGGEDLRLAELSVKETGELMSAEQYRALGESALRNLPKAIKFAQSLS
jgi:hypothetical protein